jgi:hypothetical protein
MPICRNSPNGFLTFVTWKREESLAPKRLTRKLNSYISNSRKAESNWELMPLQRRCDLSGE